MAKRGFLRESGGHDARSERRARWHGGKPGTQGRIPQAMCGTCRGLGPATLGPVTWTVGFNPALPYGWPRYAAKGLDKLIQA